MLLSKKRKWCIMQNGLNGLVIILHVFRHQPNQLLFFVSFIVLVQVQKAVGDSRLVMIAALNHETKCCLEEGGWERSHTGYQSI